MADPVADDPTPPTWQGKPLRSIWQREPVRVINSIFTLVAAVNAVLLGAGAYDGATAGIITGVIAALAAFTNELFTRAEVVPLRPLEDLAAATRDGPPAAA